MGATGRSQVAPLLVLTGCHVTAKGLGGNSQMAHLKSLSGSHDITISAPWRFLLAPIALPWGPLGSGKGAGTAFIGAPQELRCGSM
jgi:hypothetical protein